MGLKIPQNQIVESKYTSGGEYMFVDTQNEYKGYYYELNGKLFAGKEFNANNPEIIKITSDKFNKLLGNASTYTYGRISGVKINTNIITSLPSSTTTNLLDRTGDFFLKFYCQKIIQSPIVIKEINEETYKNLQKNPLYKTTFIGTYNNKTQTPDIAEQQMPGIKTFLGL